MKLMELMIVLIPQAEMRFGKPLAVNGVCQTVNSSGVCKIVAVARVYKITDSSGGLQNR